MPDTDIHAVVTICCLQCHYPVFPGAPSIRDMSRERIKETTFTEATCYRCNKTYTIKVTVTMGE